MSEESMWGSKLLYVPKFLENFKGPNFLCFLNLRIWSSPKYKASCHIIGLYSVGMDSDQPICVLLLVLGKKIPVFYLSSKIFYSRTRLWVKWQEWRLSDFLLLWTIQLNKLSFWACMLIQARKPACFNFLLLSSAWVSKQVSKRILKSH